MEQLAGPVKITCDKIHHEKRTKLCFCCGREKVLSIRFNIQQMRETKQLAKNVPVEPIQGKGKCILNVIAKVKAQDAGQGRSPNKGNRNAQQMIHNIHALEGNSDEEQFESLSFNNITVNMIKSQDIRDEIFIDLNIKIQNKPNIPAKLCVQVDTGA